MKIGIISDTHENFHNLYKTLDELKKRAVNRIFHLGDFINPGIVRTLAQCGLPVHGVWGNNDGDKVLIMRFALAEDSQLTMADRCYDFVEVDGRNLFLTHYPDLARPMAESGRYDAVFYGHDHEKHVSTTGDCLIVNPGEVAGLLTGRATCAVYDTETNTADIVPIPDSVNTRTPFVIQRMGGE